MACFGRRETEFFCHVVLLDESEFPVTIQSSTKGQQVLDKVFEHLNLLEKDYFGLRYIDKSSLSRWLDPMKLVMKQLKSGPPYLLYFCVKFYASDPCCLHEELTRYLFFQQLKRDIFQGRLPCSQNILAEISAYAIQSELGDHCTKQHTLGYVSEFRFIPKQTEELEAKIRESHKKLMDIKQQDGRELQGQRANPKKDLPNGIVPSVAEFMYLDKVKWLEMYGVDLHLVKAMELLFYISPGKIFDDGEDDIEYFVALKPAGVVVYNKKTPVGTYLWPKITKIDFKRKKFYLSVLGKEGREYIYVFYLASKSACKHLWKCCVEHHAFFRLDKVKPPPQSNFNGFMRTGSGFRYSGRTQREALEEGNRIKRSSPWVQRKPSKRYERRDSQVNERGNKSNQSPIKNGVIPSGVNNNGPITTPDGSSYVASPQYGMNDSRGPGMPWEELAQTQAGLYTPAPESPRSTRSTGSTGKRHSRSPKFPKPHRRSGQSSGSETDTSRKHSRSRSAYYSDDDAGRRRRHHKRSHSHVQSPDSTNENYSQSQGSHSNKKTNSRVPVSMEEIAQLGDAAPYHWDNVTRDHNTRRHRHHRSDGQRSYDGRSDGSSRPRQSRGFSDYNQGDSHSEKMVPALDIIQPRVALTREAKELRHRHHRHHRHSHHGNNPPSESGHSAFSAPPGPPTKLFEVGPKREPYVQQASQKQISGTPTQNWAPVLEMYDNSTNRPTFYGSLQRYSSYGQGEAMNGSHDWYSFAKANGHVSTSPPRHMDYIEVVSGPPPHHDNEQLYQYNTPSGKSTFL